METFRAILLGFIGSSGLFSFIIFLITRKDNKKQEFADIMKRLDMIEKKQDSNELASTRSELLILMNHYKSERAEIMKVAERYFKDLNGDFYMTSLFNKWLRKNDIDKPDWFNDDK